MGDILDPNKAFDLVITREILACKSIYDQFTMMTAVVDILNTNASKVPQKAKSKHKCLPLTQHKRNANAYVS